MKKRSMGAPTTYTPEIASRICEEIASGKSVREICRADDMPDMRTVFRWLAAHADFCQQYARAREAQTDYLAEELLEIADDSGVDVSLDEHGNPKVDGEAIQRAKLRVDTRKWLMAKLQPKKYGDKITNELTGAGGAPLVPVLNVTIGGNRPASSSETG